jgi:hypothetical protein
MPLIGTRGAASVQGFGEFAQSAPANYIEDVFSTWLYTGTASNQTITNGIDLSTKGGLVWIKGRSTAYDNCLTDTARGNYKRLESNSTGAQFDGSATSNGVALTTSGFTVSAPNTQINASGDTYASWTFREQPKFFDVVTYTGTGANRTVAHNLGSVPGCIMVKRTDTTGDWQVYHQDLGSGQYLVLNSTAVSASGATRWNSTTPTSTVFSLGTATTVNASGGTYVAYLFAHNAGGFGLTGTDNVISCGNYTGNGVTAGPSVTLGYEPQWVMIKNVSGTGNWVIQDIMRGMPLTPSTMTLFANLADAEAAAGVSRVQPTATGFQIANTASADLNASGEAYIYIAIRRGPMKVPTDATKVYFGQTATNSSTIFTPGFPVDMMITNVRTGANNNPVGDRLRGSAPYLFTQTTGAESSFEWAKFNGNTGQMQQVFFTGAGSYMNWMFRRAPGFFDEVCYTGTGSATTFAHNLAAVPELMIVKGRSNATGWNVYSAPVGATGILVLNGTNSVITASTVWNNTAPTSSVFTVATDNGVNASGRTYVNYLFATCPGVSKVGSYTGTGTTQVINCGFTAGSRFVLIKRTDSTGDWYVWDSARGIVAGNDPYLLLNSTAAEVTNTDYVDTASTGFEISSTAPAAINDNGGTFIFLAIA